MSLSSRLVWVVSIVVATVLLLFAAATTWRLSTATYAQGVAIEQRMQSKFIKQLELKRRLAASFLERVEQDVVTKVAALAGRDEIRSLIKRRNMVPMDMAIQKASTSYGLDAILILDRRLKALGSHKPGLNLTAVNKVFEASELYEKAKKLTGQRDREKAQFAQQYFELSASDALAIGMDSQKKAAAAIAYVSMRPVFDESGEVLAIIVGYRKLKTNDMWVNRVANTRNLAIEFSNGSKVLLRAGMEQGENGSRFYLSQCAAYQLRWSICVHTPRSEMISEAKALKGALKQERDTLFGWIAILSILSLLCAAVLASYITRRVMAPLNQITHAVRSVAKGNWMIHVAGQKRADEVGEIARAITVFQKSVKEREQLQVDVADVESVRVSCEAILGNLKQCRAVLRAKLFKMSDRGEKIENALHNLGRLSQIAEGKADETRLIVLRMMDKQPDHRSGGQREQKLLREAIERLGETIQAVENGNKETSLLVDALLGDVGDLDKTMKLFLQEANTMPMTDGPSMTSDDLHKAA